MGAAGVGLIQQAAAQLWQESPQQQPAHQGRKKQNQYRHGESKHQKK